MRKIDEIIVHVSATVEGKKVTAEDIDRMHKKKGWSGIGYHYVIRIDGTLEEGRPLKKIGAHVRGRNKNSIGICIVGGLNRSMKPKDTRTPMQNITLTNLLITLTKQFPEGKILGHRDTSPDTNKNGKVDRHEWLKACPCYDAAEEHRWITEKYGKCE